MAKSKKGKEKKGSVNKEKDKDKDDKDKDEVFVKTVDMSEEMQKEAIEIAKNGFKDNIIEKDIASFIKKEFDKKYGPTWHCIVGRNFGSYVTSEEKHFIYLYLGKNSVLLYKVG